MSVVVIIGGYLYLPIMLLFRQIPCPDDEMSPALGLSGIITFPIRPGWRRQAKPSLR
jgi:hypothetical protein